VELRFVPRLLAICTVLTAVTAFSSATLIAQRDTTPVIVRGIVSGRGGTPLAGAIVVETASLEGARTDSLGRFRFTAPRADSLVIAVRAIGYTPYTRVIRTSDSVDALRIALQPLPPQLSAITVAASQYVASTERRATLTPLQVATTPGANADVNRAIQTLPGVQLTDEGNGIATRGGDVTETRAFVDGAPLFNPVETTTPGGTIAATVNPFLLDRITFSSGGFDATYGNAMSGIIDLRTQSRPEASLITGNVSMAGASLSAGLALPHRVGASATVSRNTITPITAVNGNPRAFDPPPNGGTLSGNVGWQYRPAGTLKLFALRQTSALGVQLDDPQGAIQFRSTRESHVAVASLRDSSERFTVQASASSSGLLRDENFTVATLNTIYRSLQSTARLEWRPSSRVQFVGGSEVERLAARFQRGITLPTTPARDTIVAGMDRAEVRTALFADASIALRDSLRLTLGTRREASGFATRAVIDPRLSLAWMPTPRLAITAAWGWFSQLPDPTYIDRGTTRTDRLPFQRAQHAIVGMQRSSAASLLRAEAWQKRWTDLVQLDERFIPVAGGRGRARGLDLFARRRDVLGAEWRATYSFVQARRTDPRTGIEAPALTDITHTIAVFADWNLPQRVTLNVGSRFATGRPFTDITSARGTTGPIPIYGPPNAERLPPIVRTDITVSKLLPAGQNRFGVVFAGIGNLFNRINAQTVTWNRDYTERRIVRSVFNRTVFIGANMAITARQ
jgi:vitamin B12 transporter